MTDQLQLRHWQQIKQAQALEYAGTPEGSAALVESKRYGLAADRIDELAAQVEVMRLALENARSWHRCDEWRDCDDESNRDAWQMQMNRIDDALALPNTAATILRLRDARTLREAAAIAVEWGNARKPGQGGHALWNYAEHIRTKADELESKNG